MTRLLAVLLLLLLAAPAEAVQLSVRGEAKQGNLLYGTASPDAILTVNGEPVPIAPDGRFVIGLDRDAPDKIRIEAQDPGGGGQSVVQMTVARRDYDIQRIDDLPPDKVNPPEQELQRIADEKARLQAARLSLLDAVEWDSGFVWPVTGRITGDYGRQRILNGEPRQPHYGIDIAAPVGTPVAAPADGLVILVEQDLFFQGKLVMIDHGLGLKSTLMHLSKTLVQPGERVTKGQIVAEVGATGRVTGAHLDWRMNWLGNWIDPAQFVPPMPR